MSFGTNLKKAINEAGLTQAEFAERVGMCPSTLNQNINNGTLPSIIRAAEMAAVLGVSIEALLGAAELKADILSARCARLSERDRAIVLAIITEMEKRE